MISLRNPHSVEAVLETRPRDVVEVIVPAKAGSVYWDRVAKRAQSLGISVQSQRKSGPRPSSGPQEQSSRFGIAEAVIRERAPISIEELVAPVAQNKNMKGLWLALDQLQDPHNVGAVFRSAAFFGVKGVILTQERSAPLTATVYDVASGGLEYVPFAIQTNLQRAFEVAKDAGMWILGSSEHAHDEIQSVPKDRPWLLVLGNEETGMRRLTEEACDVLCKIPGPGKVTSLNVAVSAGILIQNLTGSGVESE